MSPCPDIEFNGDLRRQVEENLALCRKDHGLLLKQLGEIEHSTTADEETGRNLAKLLERVTSLTLNLAGGLQALGALREVGEVLESL